MAGEVAGRGSRRGSARELGRAGSGGLASWGRGLGHRHCPSAREIRAGHPGAAGRRDRRRRQPGRGAQGVAALREALPDCARRARPAMCSWAARSPTCPLNGLPDRHLVASDRRGVRQAARLACYVAPRSVRGGAAAGGRPSLHPHPYTRLFEAQETTERGAPGVAATEPAGTRPACPVLRVLDSCVVRALPAGQVEELLAIAEAAATLRA